MTIKRNLSRAAALLKQEGFETVGTQVAESLDYIEKLEADNDYLRQRMAKMIFENASLYAKLGIERARRN